MDCLHGTKEVEEELYSRRAEGQSISQLEDHKFDRQLYKQISSHKDSMVNLLPLNKEKDENQIDTQVILSQQTKGKDISNYFLIIDNPLPKKCIQYKTKLQDIV